MEKPCRNGHKVCVVADCRRVVAHKCGDMCRSHFVQSLGKTPRRSPAPPTSTASSHAEDHPSPLQPGKGLLSALFPAKEKPARHIFALDFTGHEDMLEYVQSSENANSDLIGLIDLLRAGRLRTIPSPPSSSR
jgi:hypothetical protein